MPRKRTFATWAAICFVTFDIAAEVARLTVCIVKPDPSTASLCADPIGPISRLVSNLFQLMSEEPPPPVEPKPPEPPPVVVPKGGTKMEQLRKLPTL